MRKPRDTRRDEIAAAALGLLAEHGPGHLTARNLGARVGMDGSSLFRHFDDKGAILHAAIDQFEEALASTIPDEEPGWQALRTFFFRRLRLVRERPEIMHLAFNQRLLVDPGDLAHAERVGAIVVRSVSFVRACLEQARSDGHVTGRVPAAAQVWIVTGILRGAAMGSMQPPPTAEAAWDWLALALRHDEQATEETCE